MHSETAIKLSWSIDPEANYEGFVITQLTNTLSVVEKEIHTLDPYDLIVDLDPYTPYTF
jgi:hypothetical protein